MQGVSDGYMPLIKLLLPCRNERHSASSAANTVGWSAHHLTFGERKPFTKAADGWSAQELEVAGFSLDIRCVVAFPSTPLAATLTALWRDSRQVAMALEPGWQWVEGELKR